MTFLVPSFVYAAVAVATVMAALHFLVTRQPRAAVLPTARFVPNLPATATSRAARPADILLLLLRMLVVLAAGIALAGPIRGASRERQARIIVADASAAVSDIGPVRDSVRALYREGDVLIVFDSSARVITGVVTDTLASLTRLTARGNLSAALVAAIRAGSDLRERADSFELVVISPFAAEEWDAATSSIRSQWRGRARLVRAGTRTEAIAGDDVPATTRAAAGDPMTVTLSLMAQAPAIEARVVRDALAATDADWARTDNRVLVAWPVASRPPGAISRARQDPVANPATAGGVASKNAVVIAAFERQWRFPDDSLVGAAVTARWIDGEPAVIERQTGDGCIRSVAIPVATAGDLAIRPEFISLARDMVAPCWADALPVPLETSKLTLLAGSGGFAPYDAFRARGDVESALAPWLFGLAAAAAIAELFVRRRGRRDGGEGAPT